MIPSGSLVDLEPLQTSAGEVEEIAFANELFSRLSAFSQWFVTGVSLGIPGVRLRRTWI